MSLSVDPYEDRLPVALVVFLFLVFAMMTIGHFDRWASFVWMGDDLIFYFKHLQGKFLADPWTAVTEAPSEKYRPVAHLYLWVEFNLFGPRIGYYVFANIVVHALSCAVFFCLAWRMCRGRWLLAALAALTFCWSRFALFQVGQATGGPVENLPLLFFLLALYSYLRPALVVSSRPVAWLWISVGAMVLAVYCHERYILVPITLAGALPIFYASADKVRRLDLWAVSAGFLAVAASNFLIKKFLFGTSFLVGTGGTYLTLDVSRILSHTLGSVISIFGFNYGPEYLYGVKITSLPLYYWILAACIPLAAACLALLIVLDPVAGSEARRSWRYPMLFLLLAGALLVPAVATIRVEQRWLLAPFGLLLLMLCWAAGLRYQHWRVWASAALTVACVASIILDQALSGYFDGIYLVGSTRLAEAAKQEFIDGESAGVDPIIMVTGREHCKWTLDKGRFFKLYAGKRRKIICAPDLSAAEAIRPSGDYPIFQYRPLAGFLRVATNGADFDKVARIVGFGPNPVVHGKPFNSQPTGKSAIWVKLAGPAAPNFVLVLAGQVLVTTVNGEILTAAVPAELTSTPGTFPLMVRAEGTTPVKESPPVNFVVE